MHFRQPVHLCNYHANGQDTIHAHAHAYPTIQKHLDYLAYRSLNIIVVCVAFAAAVTIIEASYHMKLVIHDDSLVPGFAAMLIVRELAVVVTSLLLAAKIGAGIAAEVGQMKISEQIDALRLLGINPLNFLVLPRFIACLLAGAFLAIIANAVCLIAALGVTVYELDQSTAFFLVGVRRFVDMRDLLFSMSCSNSFLCFSVIAAIFLSLVSSVVLVAKTDSAISSLSLLFSCQMFSRSWI